MIKRKLAPVKKVLNPSMSETQLVVQLLEYLTYKGIYAYRQNTGAMETKSGGFIRFGTPGASDIVVIYKGKYIAIEAKVKKGKQSENQKMFERNVVNAGGIYLLVYSLEDLQKLFR